MQIPLANLRLPEKDLRASIDQESLWELADSMKIRGQLQPIGVRSIGDDLFEVVFGARRTRAAKLLEWEFIEGALTQLSSEADTAANKLIENVQRQDLTPIEEAQGLLELISQGIEDVHALQRQTGKSRAWIQNRIALANMPRDCQGALQAGVISIGVALALSEIKHDELREQYLNQAATYGMTTAEAEGWRNQAQWAEMGIAPPDPTVNGDGTSMVPEPMAPHNYNCFVCRDEADWRLVNTLIVCKPCQHAIRTSHETPQDIAPLPTAASQHLVQEEDTPPYLTSVL